MSLRDLRKMQTANDGTRTLFESIMSVKVIDALKAWRAAHIEAVLIGTLALDLYVKPRFNDEVVFLVPHDLVMPVAIEGFVRMSVQVYRHPPTGIEVRLETAASLGLAPHLVDHVFKTSTAVNGILVASPSALTAILLFEPGHQASADIINLLKLGLIDVSDFGLPEGQMKRLGELWTDAELEK